MSGSFKQKPLMKNLVCNWWGMTPVVLVLECTKSGLNLLPALAWSLNLAWHVYFQSTSQVSCTEQGYNKDILTK